MEEIGESEERERPSLKGSEVEAQERVSLQYFSQLSLEYAEESVGRSSRR